MGESLAPIYLRREGDGKIPGVARWQEDETGASSYQSLL